jgi:Glutaredoxin-like domain (DUF836)
MHLIFYSKPGCHLCEGLEEKLRQVEGTVLEMRDITMREDWFQQYQYEVPVVLWVTESGAVLPLPRISPRASVAQVAQLLQKCRKALKIIAVFVSGRRGEKIYETQRIIIGVAGFVIAQS